MRKAQCGAVSFIQRFGSALNLNLHIHMLALDGVYAADEDDQPHFQVLLAPDDGEDFLRRLGLLQNSTLFFKDSLEIYTLNPFQVLRWLANKAGTGHFRAAP